MIRVLKFGGSSVADATAISRVLDILDAQPKGDRLIIVASAVSGCTDALLALSAAPQKEREERAEALRQRHREIARRLFTGAERTAAYEALDALFREMAAAPSEETVTFGELLSTTLLARKLRCDGYHCDWLDARGLIIKGDKPRTYANLSSVLEKSEADIFVLPGFICGTPEGGVSTLGRGGSDYTAALAAAAVRAGSLQIWTDVPGIMTANPRQVPAARTLPTLSYRGALEMAAHGAKVLYSPTVAPAMERGIAIEIRNTFDPSGRYTVISATQDTAPWTGLASEADEICLVGSSEADPAATVPLVKQVLQEAGIAALEVWPEERNVLVRVRSAVEKPALRALHRAFFERHPLSEINLFIAGYGAVGKALVEMIGRTSETVAARTGKVLRILGIATSSRYTIDLGGIAPETAPARLEAGVPGDFAEAVAAVAPKGSLLVDCTDSETFYRSYENLFAAGLGIVSSNRRSFAIPYVEYAALHAAARENGAVFRYETTVGAALPILDSISRSANSCDEVVSIEAVVSCTLNQILSAYGSGVTFAALVRAAQDAGLTEADPRMDLGGRDALRKLLILSREAGVPLEETEVEVVPVIPVPLMQGSLESFYQGLEAMEPTFAALHAEAAGRGCRNRFVASLEKVDGRYRAGIRLQAVPPEHPAYHLSGTENAIIVRSAFHPSPLVIQGPGEGTRQAASSILNDILK